MVTDDRHDPSEHDASKSERLTLRAGILEQMLIGKGLLVDGEVDRWLDGFLERSKPLNGSRVVAKAWTDADFRERLLGDASGALTELGLRIAPPGQPDVVLTVVENTVDVHNVIVCTLCSCYPLRLLGTPPKWYKSPQYRSRIVAEPRQVLEEFGLTLSDSVQVRVWDSTSNVRYMVLPQRPEGTEGMDEEALSRLVRRDSLIGVSLPSAAGTPGP